VTGHGAHSHKKTGGNRRRGSASGCQNVFCFFVMNTMRPFGHLSCTDFHIFETTDVNRFPHVYTGENFPNFCTGFLQVPKQLKIRYSRARWLCPSTAQTVQLWAIGIISGASQRPKDVPFVREFWWETYGLGAISP